MSNKLKIRRNLINIDIDSIIYTLHVLYNLFISNLNYKKDLVPKQSFSNFFQYQFLANYINLFHLLYPFTFHNSHQTNLKNDEYFHHLLIYFYADGPTTICIFICMSFPFGILSGFLQWIIKSSRCFFGILLAKFLFLFQISFFC